MNRFLIISSLFLLACGESKLPQFPPEHFSKSREITSCFTLDLEKFDILKPYTVFRYNNWYVFDDRDFDAHLKLLSIDQTKVLKGIPEGNGPFEVVGYFNIMNQDGSILVDDVNHRRMIGVDIISDSLAFINIPYLDSSFAHHYPFGCGKFLELPSYGHTSFIRLRGNGKTVYSSLPMPPDGIISEMNAVNKYSIYLNTKVAVSPDKSKYAWGVNSFPYYGFGRIIDDSLYADKYYFYSTLTIGKIWEDLVMPDNEQRINVLAATSSDKYAIFLYSDNIYKDAGKFSGNTILLYSWDGEPILKLLVKERLLFITYDIERKRLIGLTEEPQGLLVEYDMSDIL